MAYMMCGADALRYSLPWTVPFIQMKGTLRFQGLGFRGSRFRVLGFKGFVLGGSKYF